MSKLMNDSKSSEKIISNEKTSMSALQWVIAILCFLVVALDGMDTAAIGFVAPALAREFAVTKSALSPVMSAALFGMSIGALVAGPLADKFGRKPVMIVSVLAFGVCTLGCAWTHSIEGLTILRFLTGLGLGGAMPSSGTLLSEYAPIKYRSLLVNSMYCGFPLGAAAGGFMAASIIPAYGWPSVFIVGGILPIILAVGLTVLPESVRFMVVKKWPDEKINKVLNKISGSESLSALRAAEVLNSVKKNDGNVRIVLSKKYRFGTFMLWIGYFMGLLVFYLMTSWLPTILQDANMNVRDASRIAALLPLGGVIGCIFCGWMMDRNTPHIVVTGALTIGGACLVIASQSLEIIPLLAGSIFIAGFFLVGSQASMVSLAMRFYPTECRASGSAWMLGIGRFGGILGAFSGGMMFELGFSMSSTIAVIAVPAFVAALAILAGGKNERSVAQAIKV